MQGLQDPNQRNVGNLSNIRHEAIFTFCGPCNVTYTRKKEQQIAANTIVTAS
jgi:hypothetical protein